MTSFVNIPVPSNTYIIIDNDNKECIVIDPGSKVQSDVVNFIKENNVKLKYIILTHEHFDHCWGANYLLNEFPSKVVATRKCAEWLKEPRNYFNKLYYNSEEPYSVGQIDIIVEDFDWHFNWGNHSLNFFSAKGHTDKGLCCSIYNYLFTGDTLLYNTRPFIKRRYGGDIKDLQMTLNHIFETYPAETVIYPGHGSSFLLDSVKQFYDNYFQNELT